MRVEGHKLIAECTAYDFKSELERKKIRDWLKSISAYANTEGGSLFFGVQNDGTVVGLDNPQSVADFISEKVNAHLDPLPEWSLIPHEIEGKAVIEAAGRELLQQVVPVYAERAIEETCINHLIHRDMAVKGSEVHIDIYDDRIEFYSPGGMLDGTRIQDQDYRKVASKRRNPILAEVFSQLDYMEKRGSGLRKIVSRTESLAAYTKDKTPYFRSDSSSFFTIIPNVNYGLTDADFQRIIDANGGKDETIERYPEIGVGDLGSTTKKLPKKTTQKLPQKTTHKQTAKQLGTTSQLIIDTLVDDPLATMDKLAAITGISPDGVKWQLDKLKKEGYIERQGSRRSGSWKVLIKK